MKISIGFITYKEYTLKYLSYFLESLNQALSFLDKEKYQIFCWDNTDNGDPNNRLAIEQYNHNHSRVIQYYTEEKNLGFSKAYNRMITKAVTNRSEYFFVINPDTMLDKDSIRLMIEVLDKDKSLASVSPKILYWDFEHQKKTNIIDTCGIILKTGLNFLDLGQTETDNGQYDNYDILGPSGAAALFKIEALKEVAMRKEYFDENFFMYREDCDLIYRLFLKNYQSKLVSQALIYHDRTIKTKRGGYLEIIKHRKTQGKRQRAWSFLNRHILFYKYWKYQGLKDKLVIIKKSIFWFILALFFEQFLLKEYINLYRIIKEKKYS